MIDLPHNVQQNSSQNMVPTRIVLEYAGYRRERAAGGILILRLLDDRRETLDAWHEDCHKLMSHWRADQPLRYLHDIRHAEQVTPYATERVARVVRRMRSIPVHDARGAILVNNESLAALLDTFFRRRTQINWQISNFRNEQDAMQWLSNKAAL